MAGVIWRTRWPSSAWRRLELRWLDRRNKYPKKIQSHPAESKREMKNATMEMHNLPLGNMGDLQPKVFHDWRLRPLVIPWRFSRISELYFCVAASGDIVFFGTPCDFSGEFNAALDSLAARTNVFPIVTSFNGGYHKLPYTRPNITTRITMKLRLMSWYHPRKWRVCPSRYLKIYCRRA